MEDGLVLPCVHALRQLEGGRGSFRWPLQEKLATAERERDWAMTALRPPQMGMNWIGSLLPRVHLTKASNN